MTTAVAAVLAGILGAIVGSFLNVVVYRLPRGESLSHPPSHCPKCGQPVKPYDNIPVLSWLLLRGRCRHCKEPISARYPLVEAGTALLCALVVVVKGADEEAIIGIVLVLLLVPITLIDLDHHLIPNKITYPGFVVGVVLVAALTPDELVESLIASAGAGGFLFVAWFLYPRGMGMGDVKLAFVLGIYLGKAVVPAMFTAFIAGAVVGGIIIARLGVKDGRKAGIPFGPWLALGGLVGLLAGDAIVDWYVDTFI
ncbi:MAG TPA: prepilin peptidase [Solirubrobacteraceae bacterium]|nr:prepilin peptidase [Solirubrobacteraceae bacterium]